MTCWLELKTQKCWVVYRAKLNGCQLAWLIWPSIFPRTPSDYTMTETFSQSCGFHERLHVLRITVNCRHPRTVSVYRIYSLYYYIIYWACIIVFFYLFHNSVYFYIYTLSIFGYFTQIKLNWIPQKCIFVLSKYVF